MHISHKFDYKTRKPTQAKMYVVCPLCQRHLALSYMLEYTTKMEIVSSFANLGGLCFSVTCFHCGGRIQIKIGKPSCGDCLVRGADCLILQTAHTYDFNASEPV